MPPKKNKRSQKFLKVISPSKVNLSLRVLKKRPDGYHELLTVFERLSLCDFVTLKTNHTGTIKITSTNKTLPRGSKNLAWKAASLIKEKYAPCLGVDIHIEKNIPIKAGLGGGSSNAAAVLCGLNKLWNLQLSTEHLLRIASLLGSDVAFFVLEQSFALGSGRGEKLRVIKAPNTILWHCLVKPRTGISTPLAYKGLPPSSLTPSGGDAKMLVHSIVKGDLLGLCEKLYNTLELSQINGLKTILKMKNELLRQGAMGALMSGSGSCVFGIFASKKMAMNAAVALKQKNRHLKIFVASTF